MDSEISIKRAEPEQAQEVYNFLEQFFQQELLLPRTLDELKHLIQISFIAERDGTIVGFSAVEVYSKKLAEIQCMCVCPSVQRMGVGRRLVDACVGVAAEYEVLELMAISSSADFLQSCGFDYSLPNQKRALFIQPGTKKDPQ